MKSIFLIINIFLLFYEYISINLISEDTFEEDYFSSIDDLSKNDFSSNIYLPEYQNKFSRINELNDSNFNFMKIKNNRSVALIPDNIIGKNEKILEIKTVDKLINQIENEENNNDNYYNDNSFPKKITKIKNEKKLIYSDDYSFYGKTNILTNEYSYK